MHLLRLFRHPDALVDLEPDELERQIQEAAPVVLVDVRTPREYESGHIAGAVSVPWGREATLIERWPVQTPLVLECKTGHRSQAAAWTAFELGYRQVAHLQGGMDQWKRRGKPVEGPTP